MERVETYPVVWDNNEEVALFGLTSLGRQRLYELELTDIGTGNIEREDPVAGVDLSHETLIVNARGGQVLV